MTKTGLPTIDSAITFLESELQALDQRRARIVAAIDGLRLFAGDAETASQPEAAEAPPPRPQLPALSSTNDSDGLEAKVLELLSAGPLSPRQINETLQQNRTGLTRLLGLMRAKGLVTVTGMRRAARYSKTVPCVIAPPAWNDSRGEL
jgi:hypothetical protein